MKASAEPSAETPQPLDGEIATLTNGSQSHNLTRSPIHTPVTESKLRKGSDGRRGLGTPRVASKRLLLLTGGHMLRLSTRPLSHAEQESCAITESFRFWDDYEYKIFSVLSSALAWTSVILAGKRDSRRHSTTSFSENVIVAGTIYQILEV